MKLLTATMGNLLNEVATRWPESECLIDLPKGRRYTY